MEEDLRQLVGYDERVMYEGKPDKKCYILEGIFNPMLPFAFIWFCFDAFFIFGAMTAGGLEGDTNEFIPWILFVVIHMLPVWIYLSGVIFIFRKYRNSYYIVTDHAVYISSGTFTKTLDTKTFAECSNIGMHRGIMDQICNTGDVNISTNQMQYSKNNRVRPVVLSIASIPNYSEVYNMVKRLQKDIYSDTMYPNDLRPEENHGYKTKYRG